MSGKNNKRKRRAERRKNSATNASSSVNDDDDAEPSPKHSITNKKLRRNVSHTNGSEKVATMTTASQNEKCLIFQDVMKPYLLGGGRQRINRKDDNTKSQEEEQDGADMDKNDVSLAFFDLANAPMVGYRIEHPHSKATNDKRQEEQEEVVIIQVQQDITACGNHTGGIVWETAYLLLQYLLAITQTQLPKSSLGKTLEVGAGCGLLGQVLAAQNRADMVVMTETKPVMNNLQANVNRNHDLMLILRRKKQATAPIRVHDLDWQHVERDAHRGTPDLKPHSFDTIVGTDVVFTVPLVEPLWKTLQFMSHAKTNIYLCLQERCAAAHKLLLEKAPEYQFHIQDITHQLDDIPSCRWGSSLECRLFHITRSSK